MGQDGVQKGAHPPKKKKMLTGTPKQSFLVPNTFWMTGNGLGGPRTRLVKCYLPGTVSSLRDPTRARGAKMGQDGVQKGARPLKTCVQAPKAIIFGPKHILDDREWVGRPQDPTCKKNLPPRDRFQPT